MSTITKQFCDVCGDELGQDYVSDRYCPKLRDFELEVSVCYKGTWNDGNICYICLFKVFNNGKESKK